MQLYKQEHHLILFSVTEQPTLKVNTGYNCDVHSFKWVEAERISWYFQAYSMIIFTHNVINSLITTPSNPHVSFCSLNQRQCWQLWTSLWQYQGGGSSPRPPQPQTQPVTPAPTRPRWAPRPSTRTGIHAHTHAPAPVRKNAFFNWVIVDRFL